MEPQHRPHEAVDETAISETIYGMITVLALILVLWENPRGPWQAVVTIVAATCALAFAKAYASTAAEVLPEGEHLTRQPPGCMARGQAADGVPPTAHDGARALGTGLLAARSRVRDRTGVGVFSLLFAGCLMGRRVGLSRFHSPFSSLAIGVASALIILLKVLIHR